MKLSSRPRSPRPAPPRLVPTVALLALSVVPAAARDSGSESTPIDFSRDIRPLLSDKCFQCHGPDAEHRKARLRLDTREGAFRERRGVSVLVPGDAEASELFVRIAEEDFPDERMPPPDSGKSLTEDEIALIQRWIEEGATWEGHWSFVAPTRPAVPEVGEVGWPANEIDGFVLARLEAEGLQPSPAADRRTLIRRVSLDLTGLPPTIAEVEAFLADDAPDAYERVVDRLLQSDRYGEHMARYWLDAARYGDTHGLHLDNYREMWPYRDWVIRAFNEGMPWDEFTTKNLAGDLLPEPTTADLVASGFNRAHVTTNEGGSIAEEVLVRNVVDRVSTFGTVFLGLTMGCAVCHDHKFDPITARDFYSLSAFFNNLDGAAMDGNAKAHAPVIQVPSPRQEQALTDFDERIARLAAELDAPIPAVDAAQAEWEVDWSQRVRELWTTLDPVAARSSGGAALAEQADHSLLASGKNPDKDTYTIVARTQATGLVALRLEALADPSLKDGSNGRAENGNSVLSELEAEVRPLADLTTAPRRLRFIAASADHSQARFPIEHAIDGKIEPANGWATEGYNRKESRSAVFVTDEPFGFEAGTEIRVTLRFESQYPRHAFGRVRLSSTADGAFAPNGFDDWQLLGRFDAPDGQSAYATRYGPEDELDFARTYGTDGALAWEPKPEFEDGKVNMLPGGVGAWYLHRRVYAPEDRTLDVSLGSDDAIQVWLNGRLVFENNVARGVRADQDEATLPLVAGTNDLLIKITDFGGGCGFYFRAKEESADRPSHALLGILATAAAERSAEERLALRDYFRRNRSPEWRELADEKEAAEAERVEFDKTIPTTLVMKERADPRPAYLLKRGQYDTPDEELGALPRAVPEALPPLPEGASVDRMGLAQWLTSAANPLMARVAVNRFWQQCFGTGIVATAGDFGSQGAWPTHPALLDWLAVDFRENGWDVKRLLKQVVTSSTYRQRSTVSVELLQRDPSNQLLARGPRFRLDAEVLRDQALATSGLLLHRLGGEPVKPPQPSGLWKAVAYVGSNTMTFEADTDADKVHRRSLYTFWKRTAPAPQMSTLDAPSREACVVRRDRTNTPLQALLLLNDPQYVETARHLAQRAITEAGDSPAERASRLFLLATLRPPRARELDVLVQLFHDRAAHYRDDRAAAESLAAVGSAPRDEAFDPVELAAWTLVANAVLNLDEVVNKE